MRRSRKPARKTRRNDFGQRNEITESCWFTVQTRFGYRMSLVRLFFVCMGEGGRCRPAMNGQSHMLDWGQHHDPARRAASTWLAAAIIALGGHGESQPKGTNDTPEGRARNRRAALRRL